jgi:hypothetical protein
LEIALSQGNHAQKMPSTRVVRVHFQDLPIESLGPQKIISAMGSKGRLEEFFRVSDRLWTRCWALVAPPFCPQPRPFLPTNH